jgi:cold shock CspA family protein/ribosome-associated translation inhibitor RaiA
MKACPLLISPYVTPLLGVKGGFMELEIESRNVGMTPRWKQEIETRMADLQRGYDDVTHGRVTLTKNPHHKKLSNVAEALVVVSLPGRHTFTARKENKTFEEAIRKAFAAVAIELKKFRGKRATKEIRTAPTPPLRGVVCKLFPKQAYGFILQEGGGEVYFHKNALQGLSFKDLEDGTEVAFNLEEGQKGPQATAVHPIPAFGA